MRRLAAALLVLPATTGCNTPPAARPTLPHAVDPARISQVRLDSTAALRRLRLPLPPAALPDHVRVAAEAADPGAVIVQVARERDPAGFGYGVTMRTGALVRTWRFDDAGRLLGWREDVPLQDLPPLVTTQLVRVRPEADAERATVHHARDGQVLGYQVQARDPGGSWTLWIPPQPGSVRIWRRLEAVLELPAHSPASHPASNPTATRRSQ